MQKHRYKVSFLLTTLFYLLAIAGYFVFIENQHFTVEQKPQEKIITLALNEFVPPEPKIIEPVVEAEPEPELEPEEVVEPEAEPEPEVIEPEPLPPEPVIIKPIEKPKPIVKKAVKKPVPKKKKPVKKKRKKKTGKKIVKKRVHKKVTAQSAPSRANLAKKSQFLARLRAKINRAKSYPRIAQRRGMQGIVKVRFTILANGKVGNISMSGPKVFHNSARSAIKSAFPISTKNAPFSLPTTVNLSLRYQLR
ncbi:energy transducer TonB [Sulfurovum sp.]|uniref:energy transducer TonB n=1 Tax=Sulfurovum sp. TaxID=1969726 RepID=UPI0025D8E067|nr:TonB family protein [Sulfurovum sp.]